MTSREELIRAVQAVTWNASNYPEKVQPHILGQGVEPLTMKIVDAVEAVFEQAQTPTDDEREALASRWLSNYHGSIDATALTLAFKAGYDARRTVQGEPTDAQVHAALSAYWGAMNVDEYGSVEGMRAALRAAGGVS